MMEDSQDPTKYKSRKYRMSLICLFLITIGFFAKEGLAGLEAVYGQFIAGVLGVLTVYLGGNVTNKFVVAKAPHHKDDVHGPK
jgi:hypothetical protein